MFVNILNVYFNGLPSNSRSSDHSKRKLSLGNFKLPLERSRKSKAL